MNFSEFLEVLCRLALHLHAKSEMNGLPLAEKLKTLLRVLFGAIDRSVRLEDEEYEPYFPETDGNTTVSAAEEEIK